MVQSDLWYCSEPSHSQPFSPERYSASKSGNRCWQAIADSHTPASGRNALAEWEQLVRTLFAVPRSLSVPTWASPPERAHLRLPTWACPLSVPTWACPPELATWACLPERAHLSLPLERAYLSVPTWACPLERAYLSVPTWACPLERTHLSEPTWACPPELVHLSEPMLSVPTWACPCTLACPSLCKTLSTIASQTYLWRNCSVL